MNILFIIIIRIYFTLYLFFYSFIHLVKTHFSMVPKNLSNYNNINIYIIIYILILNILED